MQFSSLFLLLTHLQSIKITNLFNSLLFTLFLLGFHLFKICSTSIFPVIFDFLEQDYSYNSLANQIPYDAGLASICPAGGWTRDNCMWDSDSISEPLLRA